MSSNSFGDNFRITTFGESHGVALGVVIDGTRAGIPISVSEIQRELDRRKPGQSRITTPRKEDDAIEILSGIFEGKTTGAPIAMIVRNQNARSQDYEAMKELFRPGHADFTWWKKFGIRDWRGGGRTSGRETVARVAAGSIAKQILADAGVSIIGHVVQIGPVHAERFDAAEIERNPVRCADPEAAARMIGAVEAARKDGDSLGGVVEVRANGVPVGWGDPVFGKLDAQFGAAMLSIGAVKGVEIGDGFALASRRGTEANDPILPEGVASNHMGGMLGGISNGAPIVLRLAVKPTSSIRHEQQTIDTAGESRTIRVTGRHDPCICPRLVPVAEAMAAIVLCDAYLRQQAITEAAEGSAEMEAELAFCDAEILRAIERRARLVSASAEPIDDAVRNRLVSIANSSARSLGLSESTIEHYTQFIRELTR